MRFLRTIRNCRPTIPVPCPKRWEALLETADASIRHCGACAQNVYFCSTDEETLAHAHAGHCVARQLPDQSELANIVLGRPSSQAVESTEQREARIRTRREHAIDDILAWDMSAYDRSCPTCGYPVPNFRVTCRVCATPVGRFNSTKP